MKLLGLTEVIETAYEDYGSVKVRAGVFKMVIGFVKADEDVVIRVRKNQIAIRPALEERAKVLNLGIPFVSEVEMPKEALENMWLVDCNILKGIANEIPADMLVWEYLAELYDYPEAYPELKQKKEEALAHVFNFWVTFRDQGISITIAPNDVRFEMMSVIYNIDASTPQFKVNWEDWP